MYKQTHFLIKKNVKMYSLIVLYSIWIDCLYFIVAHESWRRTNREKDEIHQVYWSTPWIEKCLATSGGQ